MEKNPISFLQEYMVKRQIMPAYNVIESRNGTHQNWFKIRVDCGSESADGEGTSKKEAKLNAVKRMMQLLGISLDQHDLTSTVNSTNVSKFQGNIGSSTFNYISSLQEIAQQKGNPMPVYNDKPSIGPSHCPKFTTVCQYDGIEEEASAATKKESKTLAAQKVFERVKPADPMNCDVEESNSQVACNNSPISTIDTTNNNTVEINLASNFNYIGALQEMAQKNGTPPPKFENGPQTGPPHAPTFTIICKFNGFEEEVSGSSKKETKTLAAKKVFQRMNPAHSLNGDVKVCHSQVEFKSYLDTVDQGIKGLQLYEEDQNAMAKSAEKALKLFLPLSKTTVTKTINSEDELSYSDYHTFLRDSFSDTVRAQVYGKLEDLIGICENYEKNNDYSSPIALLQKTLEELNIQVKEVKYDLREKGSVFGLQLNTNPVISEIGHGDSKLNAVIQSVIQMAVTICILIA